LACLSKKDSKQASARHGIGQKKKSIIIIILIIIIIIIIIINLSNIPGKHDIKELRKTAILGTAHALREVLM
jgi:t-SNARE complex subunit (syntaxin)